MYQSIHSLQYSTYYFNNLITKYINPVFCVRISINHLVSIYEAKLALYEYVIFMYEVSTINFCTKCETRKNHTKLNSKFNS